MTRCCGYLVVFVLMSLTAAPRSVVLAQGQDSVASGFGKVTFNGLLQVWYLDNAPEFDQTFRIRRTELRFSGTFGDHSKWTVMIDPSRALNLFEDSTLVDDSIFVPTLEVNQSSRILQDALITVEFGPSFNVDVGQRKVPLSLVGLQSSAELKTVERALMYSDRARGGDFGDVRDIGVMAYGAITKHVGYQAGLFNGLGENQNNVTTKDELALAARVVARPDWLRGFALGASGGVNGGPDTGERRRRPFAPRWRLGGEGLFKRGRWTAQSEIMGGRDDHRKGLGTYVLAAYHITSIWEVVGQVDFFDPDLSQNDNRFTTYELDFLLGVNFYLRENHLKFQANPVLKTFGPEGPASRVTFLMNFQASW